MRRLFFTACLILAASCAFAQEFKLSAGAKVGYELSMAYDYIPSIGKNENGTLNLGSAGIFFDATYARLAVSFMGNISPRFNTSSNPIVYLTIFYLTYEAIVKYPLPITPFFTLWSGAGIKFIQCLFMDEDSDGSDDRLPDSALDDFLLVMTVGADFTLWKTLVISPALSLEYNLTPNFLSSEPADARHTSILFGFSLSVGFVF